MRFDIITIFPEIFDSYLKGSLIARAQQKKLIKINIHNLRKWATDRHQTVDDKAFGGGRGMVVKVEPIFRAVSSLTELKINPFGKLRVNAEQCRSIKKEKLKINKKKTKVILFTPRGIKFNQKMAARLAKLDQIILISGRYEGVDERIAKHLCDEKISIGNYVLMGGDLPALVLIEAVARLVPGVIGKSELLGERITRRKGFIEYPQYTRPEIFSPQKGINWRAPKVLLSGNHQKIKEWRKKHSKVIE